MDGDEVSGWSCGFLEMCTKEGCGRSIGGEDGGQVTFWFWVDCEMQELN